MLNNVVNTKPEYEYIPEEASNSKLSDEFMLKEMKNGKVELYH